MTELELTPPLDEFDSDDSLNDELLTALAANRESTDAEAAPLDNQDAPFLSSIGIASDELASVKAKPRKSDVLNLSKKRRQTKKAPNPRITTLLSWFGCLAILCSIASFVYLLAAPNSLSQAPPQQADYLTGPGVLALAVTDEIYEHIVYDGATHLSIATLPGMRERTITISGISKTYAVTGWRIGYCIAPPRLTDAIRKVHDFLTVGAPAPLQEAAAVAMGFDAAYYAELARAYQERRDVLVAALREAGFACLPPAGAYYIMADISALGFSDDVQCARWLVEHAGVAAVPGSSFYHAPGKGSQQVRFAFPKRLATLEEAGRRLLKVRDSLG